jgi:hypothetical protein
VSEPGMQKHGIVGYRRHKCRCSICRAANAAAYRRWYWRNKAVGKAGAEWGPER